jgi:hypothetical protein
MNQNHGREFWRMSKWARLTEQEKQSMRDRQQERVIDQNGPGLTEQKTRVLA